jgi:signal transduction histidine kinase
MRVDEVIDNLLANAAKYGAGSLVELSADADEMAVHIAVRDEGIGIAREDQERIFDQFERATADRKPHGGFGLGLWIARKIAEAHGGEIRVSSRLGHGSTFDVVLPREAAVTWSRPASEVQ